MLSMREWNSYVLARSSEGFQMDGYVECMDAQPYDLFADFWGGLRRSTKKCGGGREDDRQRMRPAFTSIQDSISVLVSLGGDTKMSRWVCRGRQGLVEQWGTRKSMTRVSVTMIDGNATLMVCNTYSGLGQYR